MFDVTEVNSGRRDSAQLIQRIQLAWQQQMEVLTVLLRAQFKRQDRTQVSNLSRNNKHTQDLYWGNYAEDRLTAFRQFRQHEEVEPVVGTMDAITSTLKNLKPLCKMVLCFLAVLGQGKGMKCCHMWDAQVAQRSTRLCEHGQFDNCFSPPSVREMGRW